jgi:hypothetical protein
VAFQVRFTTGIGQPRRAICSISNVRETILPRANISKHVVTDNVMIPVVF